jgi:hypothetical protein
MVRGPLSGFCSARQALVADAAECCLELFLAGGGVVLGGDLPAGPGEIDRDAVVGVG